jgi:Flp pilus assembly pilin Flp
VRGGFRLQALRRQDGQTMAEYAVILTIICIALVAAFGNLSGAILNSIDSAASMI